MEVLNCLLDEVLLKLLFSLVDAGGNLRDATLNRDVDDVWT